MTTTSYTPPSTILDVPAESVTAQSTAQSPHSYSDGDLGLSTTILLEAKASSMPYTPVSAEWLQSAAPKTSEITYDVPLPPKTATKDEWYTFFNKGGRRRRGEAAEHAEHDRTYHRLYRRYQKLWHQSQTRLRAKERRQPVSYSLPLPPFDAHSDTWAVFFDAGGRVRAGNLKSWPTDHREVYREQFEAWQCRWRGKAYWEQRDREMAVLSMELKAGNHSSSPEAGYAASSAGSSVGESAN